MSGTATKTSSHKSKKTQVQALLRRAQGASVEEIRDLTGWQPHSIRAFLSREGKNHADSSIITNKTKAGLRRYRLVKQEVGQ